MVTLVAFWSTFLSFLILSCLYPLKKSFTGIHFARLIAPICLIPSIFSAFYLLKLTFFDHSIVIYGLPSKTFPLELGVYFFTGNTPVIASFVLASVLYVFLLPNQTLIASTALFGVSSFLMMIIASSTDLIISASALSFGTILLSYLALNEAHHESLVREITRDFLWQRVSDLLAFSSILLFVSQNNTTLSHKTFFTNMEECITPRILFFIAMSLRVLPLNFLKTIDSQNGDLTNKHDLKIVSLFTSIGGIILLIRFRYMVFGHLENNRTLIIIGSILVIQSIVIFFLNKDKSFLETNINRLLKSVALIALCLNYYSISVAIICVVIIYHAITFPTTPNTETSRNINNNTIYPERHFQPPELEGVQATITTSNNNFFILLKSVFLATISLYSNFILYRLPQILINLAQTPLRLFHNGSLRHSLLFMFIMLISFYFLWRQ